MPNIFNPSDIYRVEDVLQHECVLYADKNLNINQELHTRKLNFHMGRPEAISFPPLNYK